MTTTYMNAVCQMLEGHVGKVNDGEQKQKKNKEQQPSKRLHAVSEIYMMTYKLIQ